MEEQKNYDLTGSLFINDRKATENHPDYKGSITINGQKYWLSGWLRTNDKKDGSGKVTFISLKADQAEAKPVTGFPTMGGMLNTAASLASSQQPQPAPRPAQPAPEEEKDDLPF